MPTTTNNGWPTPADTDLVKNGADAIRDLGNAIDTTLGVYTAATPGLTWLSTNTFTTVSSYSLPANTFTSTYKNYFVILENMVFTAGSNFNVRMRSGSTDASGSNYSYAIERRVFSTNSASPFSSTGATSFPLGDPNNSTFYVDFINPQDTKDTWFRTLQYANYGSYGGTGYINLTTSYDSATIFPSAGTISGKAIVFGYKS